MIYFLQAADGTGPVKIGLAENSTRRIAEIQRMSPVPLKILTTIEGDRAREHQLHSYFSHLRQHGEWFATGDDLMDFISNPLQPLKTKPRGEPRKREVREAQPGKYRFTLKEIMTQRKLTYREVSEGARISTSALVTMALNKQGRVDLPVLRRLIDFLDIGIEELLVRVPKPN